MAARPQLNWKHWKPWAAVGLVGWAAVLQVSVQGSVYLCQAWKPAHYSAAQILLSASHWAAPVQPPARPGHRKVLKAAPDPRLGCPAHQCTPCRRRRCCLLDQAARSAAATPPLQWDMYRLRRDPRFKEKFPEHALEEEAAADAPASTLTVRLRSGEPGEQ